MKLLRPAIVVVSLLLLLSGAFIASAEPAQAYRQAINLAAQGDDRTAIATLTVLQEVLPDQSIWTFRMQAAQQLLSMRMAKSTVFPPISQSNVNLALAAAVAAEHPILPQASTWPAALLATIVPGAGHAWLGRWHDAATAALMVWPMLLLTCWAAKRHMGPVTLFFAAITLWLWSGTVFSALSLAERGNFETYLTWWQSIWQASGLPGRPW